MFSKTNINNLIFGWEPCCERFEKKSWNILRLSERSDEDNGFNFELRSCEEENDGNGGVEIEETVISRLTKQSQKNEHYSKNLFVLWIQNV